MEIKTVVELIMFIDSLIANRKFKVQILAGISAPRKLQAVENDLPSRVIN
jgi:hypothetical protein